ncbi:short chain dehydrogenase [Aspergillus heteromorphus CBS 117.55]|uniref:Short chain dehydrogenase n=1 Tax=Aspergillus heteromorphus CBS 117.55 TaxID=1448321 RepID=A0A317W7L0_9EURO|nr:short chain dehydrogenase [Aspergillus heteromorphus CBS 117.55]PWY82069.1 short chain dehydrogenase [Aspergillus heteromorphus CBS 117.55]
MLRLDKKVALITGLGQTSDDGWGIGAAIAMKLSQQGAIIFGGNRTLTAAERTKARIEAEGGICHVQQTEVTDSASVKALVDGCVERHGRIDILVNNVGKSEPGCPATMEEEIWDQQMDINLKSVYLTSHYVLPIMEKQESGGVVANVSSIAGLRYIGKPQVAYSAAKAAIMQFTKATAVIYADRRVRLNTVVPGLIYTPYTRELVKRYAPGGDQDTYMKMRDEQVPMEKMGDAWDVANATLFLVADESRYITGQELVVDGGITSSTERV